MLEAAVLDAERRRFFLETKGAVYVQLTGTVFWLALGLAGFVWSGRTWCLIVLGASVLATPIAILLVRRLAARLALKSRLAMLIPPAMLPVALGLGLAIAAYTVDPSLVPLLLVIGFATHWPVVGWMYGSPIYAVHTIVRVVLAVAIWLLWPEARFTWVPISASVVYGVTSLWILRDLRRLAPSHAGN